jgi:hypothetical protein
MPDSPNFDVPMPTGIKRPLKSDMEAYIALSEDDLAYILSYTGDDLDLFDVAAGELTDKGLIVPEHLKPGVYLCKNFRAVNVSRDRESGIIDGWDVACDWQSIWEAPEAVASTR